MAIEIGAIYDGTVTGITKFGAFVDLGNDHTGFVHISEVSHEYVENINDILNLQDSVKVKVLSVEGKKIALSIKQTQVKPQGYPSERRDDAYHETRRAKQSPEAFEKKMKAFLKNSNERLLDLKRNTEPKRGGRGGRRS